MTPALSRYLLATAALSMAVATALGAWASHGLESVLEAAALRSFEIAVEYQFVHSLGLLGLAIYGSRRPHARLLAVAAVAVAVGIVLFCGGVYTSSLDGPELVVSLAPTGGVVLIGAWTGAAVGVLIDRQAPGGW